MRSKKIYILVVLLICWVGLIAILSFQPGPQTRNISYQMCFRLLKLVGGSTDIATVTRLMKISRMLARVGLFLILGGISFCAVCALAAQWKLWKRVAVCVLLNGFVAFETEWLKVYIAGRHCTYSEMFISMVSAAAGIVIAVVLMMRGTQ